MKELLDRKTIILELGFPESQFSKLLEFALSLWSANQQLNLFSRQMPITEFVDNHIIDCLLGLSQLPTEAKTFADLGSGGGLPGVIYSIARPEQAFQLFEKSPRKQEFLSSCHSFANNFEIKSEVSVALVGVDVVTARAFKPLDVILEMTRGFYQRGGKYYLLKGRKEKIDEEFLLAKKKFKDVKMLVEPLKSPVMQVERHIVKINF
ncbi:MAG: 16S rRNA (guanine(527)-N(7))-methyltransferase RsmG [Bdellovibrionales bacterium]